MSVVVLFLKGIEIVIVGLVLVCIIVCLFVFGLIFMLFWGVRCICVLVCFSFFLVGVDIVYEWRIFVSFFFNLVGFYFSVD